MNEDGCLVTNSFSQSPEDVVGKFVVADTPLAKMVWEQFRKNPTIFQFAPGYIVKKEKDGVILEAELVEISIVPKIKNEQDTASQPTS